MRFNIKKTIIASLLFGSGASFAQLHEMQQLVLEKEKGTVSSAPVVAEVKKAPVVAEVKPVAPEVKKAPVVAEVKPVAPEVKKAPVVAEVKPVAPEVKKAPLALVASNDIESKKSTETSQSLNGKNMQAPSCPCDKPVVKKIVKKKHVVKLAKKKLTPDEINMISKNDIEVEEIIKNKTTIYLEEANISLELIDQWSKPTLVVRAKNNQGNPYDPAKLNPLNGSQVKIYNFNTDLSSFNTKGLSLNQNYDPQWSSDSCKALYVQYQEQGATEAKTKTFFLDKRAKLSQFLPENCNLNNKDDKDTTNYSSSNVITNIGFTKPASFSNKPIEFILHSTKSGKEFFGDDLSSYVLSYDFQNIYFPQGTPDKRGAYLGTKFTHNPIPKGNYNVFVNFNKNKEPENSFIKRMVQ